MKTITLTLDYDTDCENPLESCDGMWTLHTFADRNASNRIEDFFADRGDKTLPHSLALFWKLRNGLAWIVGGVNDNIGYCHYYPDEYDPTDRIRGLLVWEHDPSEMGAKTKTERKADAKSTLDEYNRWAGGDCYWYSFEGYKTTWYDSLGKRYEQDGDSCGGFIGHEYFIEAVREAMPDFRPMRVILSDKKTEGIWDDKMLPEGAEIEVLTEREYREEEAAFMALADEEAGELADSDHYERGVA